jgi:predicted  nucleic acid-binding Zn-ribbon protein
MSILYDHTKPVSDENICLKLLTKVRENVNSQQAELEALKPAHQHDLLKFETELRTKNAEIVQLGTELRTKDAEIAQLGTELCAKDVEIARLQQDKDKSCFFCVAVVKSK